jgi:hypothetical protein
VLDLGIPMTKVIELVEKGLYVHSNNRVENPPKQRIHSKSDSFIHAIPAYYRGASATSSGSAATPPTGRLGSLR